MIDYSKFDYKIKSNFPFEVPASRDFKVFLGDKSVPVYSCRISAYPFNRWWPGFQRPVSQSELVSFVNLVSDEDVELTVEPLTKTKYDKVMIKPYDLGVTHEVNDGKISFTLKKNGAYVLELDDYHGLLYIFNNAPCPCEDREAVTHYFEAGVHFPGKIELHSGDSVYLEKDALVYGCIYAEGAENIRIYGNGIFDDSAEERINEHCYENYANGNIKLYDCKNVYIGGVGFVNSAIWCVNLFHCFDVTVDAINVFGQWRYNTDGIDIVNSQRITVRNSFVHSFDDSITVKGIDRYAFENNRDILIENCILICDWGKTLEIGLETECSEYDNIVFRHCHVIRGGNTVCDIANGDRANVRNVTFEDISVEHERFYTDPMLQKSDDQEYDRRNTTKISALLRIGNPRFREQYAFLGGGAGNLERRGQREYAGVCDVTVKNVRIYADESLVSDFGKACAAIFVDNIIPTTEFKGFTVGNVSLRGKKLSREEMSIEINGCSEDVLSVD
jgi:hypothetical protein